ncbi:MAG: hypothetical protein ACXAC2_00175 [Candidatus Kariarchaeaceae archaeon]|jgi:hypothetical protein
MSSVLTRKQVPREGDVIVFEVASGVTSFFQGTPMYLTDNMEVTPCNGTNRGPAIGVAVTDFPEPTISDVKHVTDPRVSDVGPTTYASAQAAGRRVGVVVNQVAWCLIHVPVGGSTVSLSVGDDLVPSTDTAGGGSNGVEPYVRADLNATFSDTEVEGALDEQRRIIGRALTQIHTSYQNSGPALGQNAVASLAAGAADVYGWVLARIYGF